MDQQGYQLDAVPTRRPRPETTAGLQAHTGPTLISGTQINGGAFTDVGRDQFITIHNYHPRPVQLDAIEILRTMALPNFRKIHRDIHTKASDGTCVWLIKGQMFHLWIQHGTILWGIGLPGGGKSVLASIVITHLQKLEQNFPNICVACVYIRYSAALSIQDILHSLVLQIVERHDDARRLATALYAKHRHEGTDPNQRDLVGLLSSIIKLGKRAYFVLDALDELSPGDRRVLVEALAALDAKLFITSRPLPPVERHFPQAQFFHISATHSDISLLVKDVLRRYPDVLELIEDSGLQEQVIEMISQKAGGMFLHASLQLEALRSCLSAYDVEETLAAFPANLEAVYMQTWERILKQGHKHAALAKLIFLWIMHSKKELTIEELRHCIATSPETHAYEPKRLVPEALLLSVCCGLVSTDVETGLVRLIHYTVKDIIRPLVLQAFPDPHGSLTLVCTTHLRRCDFQHSAFKDVDALNRTLAKDLLLAYAYYAWNFHAHQSHQSGPAIATVAEFILTCRSYPVEYMTRVEHLGPVHLAAYYGFSTLIQPAAQVVSANAGTANMLYSGIHLACIAGQMEALTALLSLPQIDVNTQDAWGSTPLLLASLYGRTQGVKALLAVSGVDVHAVSNGGKNALMLAASGGHTETVQLLLKEAPTDVNIVDQEGRNALMLASQSWNAKTIQVLATVQNLNVNAVDKEGKNVLMLALEEGDRQAVEVLRHVSGIDLNMVNNKGSNALMLALELERMEAVDILVSLPGVDINAVDGEGRNILMLASHWGDAKVIRTLLTIPEIDVNAEDKDGRTPLLIASGYNHTEAIQTLFEDPRVNFKAVDNEGRNLLMLASYYGCADLVQVLVRSPGVDVNAVDNRGRTALMLALETPEFFCTGEDKTLAVVQGLLDAPGIDVSVADCNGNTALSLAESWANRDIALLL